VREAYLVKREAFFVPDSEASLTGDVLRIFRISSGASRLTPHALLHHFELPLEVKNRFGMDLTDTRLGNF
jgi:hypothetical protein